MKYTQAKLNHNKGIELRLTLSFKTNLKVHLMKYHKIYYHIIRFFIYNISIGEGKLREETRMPEKT